GLSLTAASASDAPMARAKPAHRLALHKPAPLDGAALYALDCAPCHGASGRGDGPEASFFTRRPRDLRAGVVATYTTDELVARSRHGAPLRIDVDREAMRRRSQDVEVLVAQLGRLPGIDWSTVERGNEVFTDRCAVCHGPFGRPTPGAPLPPGVQRMPRDLS